MSNSAYVGLGPLICRDFKLEKVGLQPYFDY
jgi:hypothetical protein